jgi:hypothetical protein
MTACVSIVRAACLASVAIARVVLASSAASGESDPVAAAGVSPEGDVPPGAEAPDPSWAPTPFLRAIVGVGGVGLHPLGGRVDRLGVSAGGLFVEGLAGVPFGPFVVGGAVDGFFAFRERVRFPDDSVRRVDRSLQALTAGPVLLWYPWGGPAGFHAGVSPRGFWVPGQAALGDVARLPAQFGAGVQVAVGHAWDWRDSSAFGAEARLGWGTTFRDDTGVSAYQFLQLTLGASVTFR